MVNKQLIFTDKILDVIALGVKDTTRLVAMEGTARSSKTASAIQMLYYAIYDSDEKRHAICGKDLDAIRNNILEADVVGLMTTHPDVIMKKAKIGGYFLTFPSPKGVKEVVLVPYADRSTWTKILGGSLGIVFIDETNIAAEKLLQETFARQLNATRPLTIMTTNGDHPDHFIYKNYYNYCRIVGDAPVSIIADVVKFQREKGKKDGYYYFHFKMSDNPAMTTKQLEDAFKIYPVGSYYYITKILGERGVQGSLIFDEYMSTDLIVNAYELDKDNRPVYDIVRYSIAMDVGANRAFNVISLVGWTKGYKKAIVLKMEAFKKVGYNSKRDKLIEFLKFVIETMKIPSARIDGVMVDNAEQNFIADLHTLIYPMFHVDVVGSWKATILERINLMIIGFSTKRILFHTDCKLGYDSYRNALWVEGKEGKEREDKNELKNDVMDTVEYALTRHMKDLLNTPDKIGGGY